MSSETEKKRSFEDRVQDRQDWIEAQFRRISRGSWARIIRMARKPSPQEFKQTSIVLRNRLVCLGRNRLWFVSPDGQFLPLANP